MDYRVSLLTREIQSAIARLEADPFNEGLRVQLTALIAQVVLYRVDKRARISEASRDAHERTALTIQHIRSRTQS